ncbi:Oidioi.mRNA.OKI2018_I69.chr2.g6032.t1.cds [Oikopleura dioica]|uniref:Oidioi.mRNA.OKI2018_I69.chr2.g6032.t1.cds n=1 Tax=Oikopleura dioica TaxID=34765 RepID=A0ABN7TB68_OIKDI|nr:Oidioi.mRNA.OKI2018_I69.chr2.g6032.t1.cds [Oikopleura dioica]
MAGKKRGRPSKKDKEAEKLNKELNSLPRVKMIKERHKLDTENNVQFPEPSTKPPPVEAPARLDDETLLSRSAEILKALNRPVSTIDLTDEVEPPPSLVDLTVRKSVPLEKFMRPPFSNFRFVKPQKPRPPIKLRQYARPKGLGPNYDSDEDH